MPESQLNEKKDYMKNGAVKYTTEVNKYQSYNCKRVFEYILSNALIF